jgi:hypothetical protein
VWQTGRNFHPAPGLETSHPPQTPGPGISSNQILKIITPIPAKPEPKGDWRANHHFFEQEVTEGTEELCADAPAFIAEIATCFWPKGSSSIPPFGILRFLLFKKSSRTCPLSVVEALILLC